MICGVCAFEGNLCLSAFSSSSLFFFASWQRQSLLRWEELEPRKRHLNTPLHLIYEIFVSHGQYLGFFEKFSQRKKKERKEQESHLLL